MYFNEQWKCKLKQEVININSNKPSFYPYSVEISQCSGSSNNINDPYTKLCALDVVKNINLKVFKVSNINN